MIDSTKEFLYSTAPPAAGYCHFSFMNFGSHFRDGGVESLPLFTTREGCLTRICLYDSGVLERFLILCILIV